MSIFIVTESEFALARAMEARLVESRQQTGILFAGVRVVKTAEDETSYHVFIGCDRIHSSEEVVGMAAAMVLKEEISASNGPIHMEVHRGSILQKGSA